MVPRGCRWPLLAVLRTICGPCADLGCRSSRLGRCPDDGTRPHTRRSLSDGAGRRKGAARPCGMGLRPTLPPTRRQPALAGYGELPGRSERPLMAGLEPHSSSRAGHEVTGLEGQGACENNNTIKSGVDEVFAPSVSLQLPTDNG